MTAIEPTQPGAAYPAGWYPDNHGVMRFWDGTTWTHHTAPPPAPAAGVYGHGPIPVQPNVRQSMDRSQYVRNQQGHSIIRHLLFGWILLWIPTIYYAISPNHYFHA